MRTVCILLAVVSAFTLNAAKTGDVRVVTWPMPAGSEGADGYAVKVNGHPVPVVGVPRPLPFGDRFLEDKAWPYSFAQFDADGEVEIEVSSPMNMSRASVLPSRLGIKPLKRDKQRIVFRAKPPFNLVVEPRMRHRALVVSANLPERDPPKDGDANVLYYGPGRHRLDKPLKVGTGQTLYLAPGSIVEGAVNLDGNNARICGRGVLSGAPWPWLRGPSKWMCTLTGTNVIIRDVTLLSSWTWTLVLNRANRVLVDNVRILNGRVLNDDGIDICRSKDVVVRNSFVRAFDDCIAPKFWCENLKVENCALWVDGANAIRIGYECEDPKLPFRRIRFKDIDVLHLSMMDGKAPDVYWQSTAVAVQASNDMVFEDMCFDGFNFDNPQGMDMLIHIKTLLCEYGQHHKQGGHVRNIVFRNIRLPRDRPLGSYGIWLHGKDAAHGIEDIAFEDCDDLRVPVGIRGSVRDVRGLSVPPLRRE